MAATDGLFDNVTEQQIVTLVTQHGQCEEEAVNRTREVGAGDRDGASNSLAGILVARAMEIGASDVAESPFAKRMYEERGTLCALPLSIRVPGQLLGLMCAAPAGHR